jgi:hypothetical protein
VTLATPQKISIWVMMIVSSPASSTRRNAGSEAGRPVVVRAVKSPMHRL